MNVGLRGGGVPSPGLEPMSPPSSPDVKRRYKRQHSEMELLDTPRKNKRKSSEPKRRTTDFSIKRLCPDSPGSACSESGRSEESTPERSQEELRGSPGEESPTEEKDLMHPHIRPPIVFPDMRHHPYFIPQFYYNRFPGYPGSEHLPPFHPGMPMPALRNVPVMQTPSHSSRQCSDSPAPRTSMSSPPPPPHHTHGAPRSVSPELGTTTPNTSREEDNESPDDSKDSKKNRKNYKNMTRERRVEANARERSRVHTISAAFDGLRRAVPSYSYNQKLSKLAILRIACSYINALTQLTDPEETPSTMPNKTFAECVDSCTRTIQTEGKARRRH